VYNQTVKCNANPTYRSQDSLDFPCFHEQP